jgi:hypothetical protein
MYTDKREPLKKKRETEIERERVRQWQGEDRKKER